MSVADVRDAIAEACRNVTLPDSGTLRASAYIPDKITPPQAIVGTVSFDPRMVFGEGKCARNLQITVYVSRTAETASQKLLDTFTELSGSDSLIANLQTDTLLLAQVDYLAVTEVRGPLVGTVGGVDYLIFEYDAEVVF